MKCSQCHREAPGETRPCYCHWLPDRRDGQSSGNNIPPPQPNQPSSFAEFWERYFGP